MTLVAQGEALTDVLWPDMGTEGPRSEGKGISSQTALAEASGDWAQVKNPALKAGALWLSAYFAGRKLPPLPALSPKGTAFQQAVWQALLAIPYGATQSYAEVAQRLEKTLGHRTAARAVGGAVGKNPLCPIIPCHRVMGKDGSMTGFGLGIAAKRYLLDLESKNKD